MWISSRAMAARASRRAVIDGLPADVVTWRWRRRHRRDRRRAKLIAADWQNAAARQQRALHLDHRLPGAQGQSEGISDWADLVKPGVAVITPNPKTSGGARWNYLAAWGYALQQPGGDEARPRTTSAQLYQHVPVLDTGARGATTTFAQRGIGDVLLAWENEASWRSRVRRRQVRDRLSVGQHPGRAAGGRGRQESSTSTAPARSPRPISNSSTRPKGQEHRRASTTIRPRDRRRSSRAIRRRASRRSRWSPSTSLRRLEEGAGDPLRRWRHVRPDLQARER